MEDLFFILLLISFFLLILGLFSPKTSLFWTKSNQTRGKSSLVYGVTTIIFFVVYGETADNKKSEKDLLEYKDGRQLLTLNNIKRNGDKLDQPEIGIIKPDSVAIGDQFLAKIFLKTRDYKLLTAYFNCDSIANPSVDTTTMDISGCEKGLYIENDTIYMAFRPIAAGRFTIEPLTLLTKDKEKVRRTMTYTFTHKVFEK